MRRKSILYLLAVLIGVIILSYVITSIDVPDYGLSSEIQKVFKMKQARMYVVEEVLEAREIGSRFNVELPPMPGLSSWSVELAQAIALSIFYVTILTALAYWKIRIVPVLLGFLVLTILGILPFEVAVESMELDLIVFLISTMVVVFHMRETGVLRYITVKVLKFAKLDPKLVLIYILILSGLLSALVGEVASIVYVTVLILEVSELFGINPVPWVMASIFATNVGSAATVIGNPIGVYIALYAGLSFTDFILWATPSSILALAVLIAISVKWLKSDIERARENISELRLMIERGEDVDALDEWSEVRDKREFYIAWALFILMVLTIALHDIIAEYASSLSSLMYGGGHIAPEISAEAALILAPILYAGVALARAGDKAREYVEKGVEWWALIFFMFLFACASALSYTGVTDKLAYMILVATGSSKSLEATLNSLNLVAWVTALTSGFIDNMPVVVALSPVVSTLEEVGLPSAKAIFWGLLLGGCLGGNLTVVGSTANIVAAGIMERYGREVKVSEWLRIGSVVVASTMAASISLILVRLII